MKTKLGTLLAAALVLGLAATAQAKGKGSNPQFPAPSPASYYVNTCLDTFTIEWTPVKSNFDGSSPTKYAIQIVQTLRSSCPDGLVIGTQVDNFTAPGNTSEFTTPNGTFDLAQVCSPDDIVILVKALNPPGRSQNNPQAIAVFESVGTGCI